LAIICARTIHRLRDVKTGDGEEAEINENKNKNKQLNYLTKK